MYLLLTNRFQGQQKKAIYTVLQSHATLLHYAVQRAACRDQGLVQPSVIGWGNLDMAWMLLLLCLCTFFVLGE